MCYQLPSIFTATLAILCCLLQPSFALAQFNTPSGQHQDFLQRNSLVRKPQLVDASFVAAHLFSRSYAVLKGRLGVQLKGENFTTDLYEVNMPERPSVSGQINIFGATFNDIVEKPKSRFWNNTFFYYSIKAAWHLVPRDKEQNSGAQHHVELGVDFGARYFPVKQAYLEAGVMLQPLAMSYINLLSIPVPDIEFPGTGIVVDEVEVGSFHMYAGAVPFLRAGFYPAQRVSIDFTLGFHAALRYVNMPILSALQNGNRINSDVVKTDINNLYLNGRPLTTGDYNFNGRMWGIGFTVHLP